MTNNIPTQDMLNWLPIGYMATYMGELPENFIEVNGQRLSKMQYEEVYDILRGNVKEDGDFFILPLKADVQNLFSLVDSDHKIILKIG